MKRMIGFLLFLTLFVILCGCTQVTGEMRYTGTYVKTSQGQHFLIHATDDGEEYFLLQEAENCKSMDKLKTGDTVTIYVACLAYEEAEISERTVLRWKKKLFSHTDVSQTVIDYIGELMEEYKGK